MAPYRTSTFSLTKKYIARTRRFVTAALWLWALSFWTTAAAVNSGDHAANPGDAGDQFGFAMTAAGKTRLYVGAPGADVNGATAAGIVYAYDLPSTSPVLTIPNPSPSPNARFGHSMASVKGGLIVGAPGTTETTISGKAFLIDVETGDALREFENPDASQGDRFGWSIAPAGARRLVIGAPGVIPDGRAYLFDEDTTAPFHYVEHAGITAEFGIAVAARNSVVAVMGFDADSDCRRGQVSFFRTKTAERIVSFVYDTTATLFQAGAKFLVGVHAPELCNSFDNSNFVQFISEKSGKLSFQSVNQGELDEFGAGAAVSGSVVVVGAPGQDDVGAPDSGRAYLYRGRKSDSPLATYFNPTPGTGDRFGSAAAIIGGAYVAIGAHGDDHAGADAGAVHLFPL